MLEVAGYKVIEARHGVEAIQIFSEHGDTVEIVLTDVLMPHMQGPELVDRLLSRQPRLKILYLTGFTDDPERIRPDADTALLTRPFEPMELTRVVRDLLDRSRNPLS